jgi:putative inorganic carbon (HCO3(-)) transporter
MVLLLPFSIKLFFPIISSVIIYPGELLIALLALLFLFKLVIKKEYFLLDRSFLLHPITIIILSYLFIDLLSAAFSSMHLVSLKAVAVRSCYILVFYFFSYSLFKSDLNNFSTSIKYYGSSLAIVAIYTLINQNQLGWDRGGAGFACHPFYNDHTIYSAVLAFILPFFIANSFYPKLFESDPSNKIFFIITTLILLIAFYFGFCRAAWLSWFITIIFFLLIMVGLRFKSFISIFAILITAGIIGYEPIFEASKNNKVDSNMSGAGLYEHFFSLTNITNDVSNKERLNRWDCSVKMAKENPLLGFGPGTYQFQYLKFQDPDKMTYISLEEPMKPGFGTFYWSSPAIGLLQDTKSSLYQGGGGTAHSEFFLELAESGFVSASLFIALFIAALFYGLKIITITSDKKERILTIAALCALATYFIHGFFNNFLDDCKVAFLFWSALCLITTISVKGSASVNSQD